LIAAHLKEAAAAGEELKVFCKEPVAEKTTQVKTHRDNFLRELGGNTADHREKLVFSETGAEAVVTGQKVEEGQGVSARL
jgi:hypothetical protein